MGGLREFAALALVAATAGCATMLGDGSSWSADLRVGTGAQGGQTSRVRLDGAVHRLAEVGFEDPFPFSPMPGPHDPPRWYLSADSIPSSKVLVLESIDVAAAAPGDANGHGEVRIALPGGDALRILDEAGPYQVWLEGRAILLPSEAAEVFVETANSSNAEVRFRGRLFSPEAAGKMSPADFQAARAPEGIERAGGKIVLQRKWLLEKPKAQLQARAGAVNGNPVRVTLLGKGTPYVRSLHPSPINTERTPSMQEESVGFTGGGRVPAGKVWVITRVTYQGTAAGDSNGPGGFRVSAGGQEIVRIGREEGSANGTWEGRIEIRPGEEASVFVEIRNSSTGSATFEGAFE